MAARAGTLTCEVEPILRRRVKTKRRYTIYHYRRRFDFY